MVLEPPPLPPAPALPAPPGVPAAPGAPPAGADPPTGAEPPAGAEPPEGPEPPDGPEPPEGPEPPLPGIPATPGVPAVPGLPAAPPGSTPSLFEPHAVTAASAPSPSSICRRLTAFARVASTFDSRLLAILFYSLDARSLRLGKWIDRRVHGSARVLRAIVVAIRAIHQATFQKTCAPLQFARDRQFRAPLQARKVHLF